MDIVKHIKQVVDEAAAFTPKINSKANYEQAGKALKTVSTAMKMVEEHYEQEKKEKYEAYKAVNAKIAELNKPLEVSKQKIKGAMNEYIEKQEAKRIKEASKKKLPVDAVAVKVPDVEGVQTVKRWTWSVFDKSKVPLEFLIVDTTAINKVVREFKGEASSVLGEGIKVFQEKGVRG